MKVIHATRFDGKYKTSSWAGYTFKESLDYTSGRHTGVDYNYGYGNQDLGQAALAVADGVVTYVGDQTKKGFGRTVIIRHTMTPEFKKWSKGKKYAYSRYMHLRDYQVKKGQKVRVGQGIGHVGNSGTRYAHLHVDLWTDKNGLGSHLEYHKDTQLDSYLDVFKTAEKWKNYTKPSTDWKKKYEQSQAELNKVKTKLVKIQEELSKRPTKAEYERAMNEVSKLEKSLKESEESSVTKADWTRLWDKVLKFFKGESEDSTKK